MGIWETKPLGQIVALQRGFDLPTQHRAVGDVAVIGSNGIVGFHDAPPTGVPIPGLMVGRSGSVGRLTYWDKEYWPLNTSLYVKDFYGNDPKFLSFWLQLFPFGQYAEGVSVPTLNRNSVNDVLFPIPEFADQQKIARALETITAGVGLQSRLLEVSQELKRATMRELFTRGLKGEAQKDSEIGPIPESWDIVPFGELISVPSGLVDPKVEPYASMPHVGPENIEKDGGLLLPLRSAKELNLISGKYLFGPGQIIYSKIRPYLNKAILADFSGVCSADMYPLDVNSAFDRHYILALIRSRRFVDQAIKDQGRTGIPKLNREQLYSMKAPKPGSDEQKEIGEISSAIDAKIDLHKRKKAVLEELFRALLHKLMTGEIRVADLDLSALEQPEVVTT